MKSKKALAFEKFKFSDPGWNAEVIPIAGSTSVAICAASVDKYTGRKMDVQQLATYAHPVTAEKVCRELNELKARMLATAYP